MRFGVLKAASPSSTRQPQRPTDGPHLIYDSDSDALDTDSDESLSFSISDAGLSSSSEDELMPKISLSQSQRSPEEIRQLEEALASIRLRTRHLDPYEEWEQRTRKEAFTTARKERSVDLSNFHEVQERRRLEENRRLCAQRDGEVAHVKAKLQQFRLRQQEDDQRLRDEWEQRQKSFWTRIETTIMQEEEKVVQNSTEERRKREEDEKKQKDEDLKRRISEEKRRAEEEQMQKEAEEKKRSEAEKKRKEEEEERQQQEEQQKKERLKAELEHRKQAGLSTADDDWQAVRNDLKKLKSQMAIVKAERSLKAEWGKCRRQIKPKIGQLTDDQTAIDRISREILEVINPRTGPHKFPVYLAILSSLAKDILLQAEIETTAEKQSAGPLARVAFNILFTVPDFPPVFFAKLVQRVGGWPIPFFIPDHDYDGRKWANLDEQKKINGFRKNQETGSYETEAAFVTRITGIMRIYFSILQIVPTKGPLQMFYQLPRCWIWFARMLGERVLLEKTVAAQLMYTALDVMGLDALHVWGAQWVKMLALIYEGVTVGIGVDKYIGGTTPEGKAARVRVQLKIEEIMAKV